MSEYFGYENLIKDAHNRITFYSFTTQETFSFPAFVTDFSDSFKSNWTPQEIYGKMDPVSTFKNTARTIQLSIDIPSTNITMAMDSMISIDNLIKGLYPIYDDSGKNGIATIAAPPLFRIKFANYITNVVTGDGLLGYLQGFDFKPDMNAGQFIENNVLYPKLLKASFSFNVLHEHPLGSAMVGNKPLPRITVNGGYSYKFAHLFSDYVFVPQSPTGGSATPETEVQLYTLRRLESGTTPNGKVGRIFSISATPYTTKEAAKQETFTKKLENGKLILVNKQTGEKIIISNANGGSAVNEFNGSTTSVGIPP